MGRRQYPYVLGQSYTAFVVLHNTEKYQLIWMKVSDSIAEGMLYTVWNFPLNWLIFVSAMQENKNTVYILQQWNFSESVIWNDQRCVEEWDVKLRGTVGIMSVFDRRTFPVLRSTCTYVGKPSAVGQPTRPTQPFILSGYINE